MLLWEPRRREVAKATNAESVQIDANAPFYVSFRHAVEPDHAILPDVEAVATDIVDAAFRVHRELGPGLLESVYEVCMTRALTRMGRAVVSQPRLDVVFEGELLEMALRPDLLVDNVVIVELKSIQFEHAVHEAQLRSYLRLSGRSVGFLINFNVPRIKQGIRRFVSKPRREHPPS